jgi:hypothetical protein
MISVYCVTINGEPILMEDENGELIEYGFYRNEFILTTSEEKAFLIAQKRTLKKLHRRSIQMVENKPIQFIAEEIKYKAPLYELFSNQGFLFYRLDEDTEEAEMEEDDTDEDDADEEDGTEEEESVGIRKIIRFIASLIQSLKSSITNN